MKKGLIIYEDEGYENFYPLTMLRPVFLLRAGIRSLYEKIIDSFDGFVPFLFCRPEISDITSERAKIPVNRYKTDDYSELIFINGRIRFRDDLGEALMKAGESVILTSDGTIVAFKLAGKPSMKEHEMLENGQLGEFLEELKGRAESLAVEVPFYNYLWDFVTAIGDEIIDDFAHYRKRFPSEGFLSSKTGNADRPGLPSAMELINPEDIYIASDAVLMPGIVLDASRGPVFIGTGVRIEPHTYIIGPAYIGRETYLVGGKIAGSSIGPVCRVGGEFEESIIQGYSNKYHAGFIGHSYLGEWINLGAMTTNSDLKNNYENVRVSLNGALVDTGLLKVGSFIGDFTKTAIGTLLNTGINIGVACNIISDGLVTDGEIPPFTWYSPRHKMAYNFVKAIGMIEKTMARRGMEPTDACRKRLSEISRLSAEPK
jgi:UDP-N-acetylglucosamine diphosphorylase/glucosamine-1-phosphate N-acetyltransferase